MNNEPQTLARWIDPTIDDLKIALEEANKQITRLNNIMSEIERELELNLKFKVIGVKRLKDKLKELKEGK